MIFNGFIAGQLGNRLFHTSQLMVLAHETNSTLVDFSFDDYKANFQNLYNKPFIVYPPARASAFKYKLFAPLKSRLPHLRDFINHRKLSGNKWLGLINQNGLVMTDFAELLKQRKAYNNYIIEGWISKDISPLSKYRKQLAAFFMPRQQHITNIETLIQKARKDVDMLIGIHIRRGDYKQYRNGEFYFDDNVYLNIMVNMQKQFPDKKIRYLICSNEEVEWANYSAYQVIPANNQIIEDMYALSYCDYIAGPISTYSMWASFIGQKPLYQIYKKDLEFDFNHFKIINDRSQ